LFIPLVVDLLIVLCRGTTRICCPLIVSHFKQGTCQRENPPFYAKNKNAAAQSVLDSSSDLRSFCAALNGIGLRTFAI
jgi:hypothetical protein